MGYDAGILHNNATQTEYELEYRWLSRTLRIERWRRPDAASGSGPVRQWWASRHGVDDFELSVEHRSSESSDLIRAIGVVRDDEMLGVRIRNNGRSDVESTFRVRGSKADVLAEVIRRYGVSVEPFKLTDDQTHVWMFDTAQQTLVYVPVEEAEKRTGLPIRTNYIWQPGRGGRVRAVKPEGDFSQRPVSVTPPEDQPAEVKKPAPDSP